MTPQRIRAAIVAHSPDGPEAALARVRAAAEGGKLSCKSPACCLLAVAWRAPMVAAYAYRPQDSRNRPLSVVRAHAFADVVYWFDALPSVEDANAIVLALLDAGGAA